MFANSPSLSRLRPTDRPDDAETQYASFEASIAGTFGAVPSTTNLPLIVPQPAAWTVALRCSGNRHHAANPK